MNELVLTILISPLLVAASQALHERVMRWIAASRLRHDPLYDVGSILLYVLEGDRKVCGRCRVHSISTGRIELRSVDSKNRMTGEAMSWSVREFVTRFDPVAETLKEPGAGT